MAENELKAWRPDWSPEDRAQIDRAKGMMRRNASLMRRFRETFGLTQADVAELLGTTQSSVSKMESKDDTRLSVMREIMRSRGGGLKLVAEMNGKKLEIDLMGVAS